MLGATAFGIFFTPLFFVVITKLFSRRKAKAADAKSDDDGNDKAVLAVGQPQVERH